MKHTSLLKNVLGLETDELHEVFAEWNKGELDSYLIEITADIFTKKDEETGKAMVDVILDTAGQKGTGKWTSQSALDLRCTTTNHYGICICALYFSYERRTCKSKQSIERPKCSCI